MNVCWTRDVLLVGVLWGPTSTTPVETLKEVAISRVLAQHGSPSPIYNKGKSLL